MTNYVSLLNDDQLLSICRIITARNFKEIFNNNPNGFNRVKRSCGYNIKKASDEETYFFVIKIRDEEFICRAINTGIYNWLKEIHEHIDKYISEGKNAEDALTETLSKSVFSEHIELYFLLSGKHYPEEYISMVQYAIQLRENLAQAEEEANEAQQKSEQIETNSNARYLESINELSALQKKFDGLLALWDTSKKEKSEREKQLSEMQSELDEYRNLAKYAVIEKDFSPAAGYTVLSLCRKYIDDNERDRLYRCADVTAEGELTSTFLENTPTRARLYQKDGPSQIGAFGIWDWTIRAENGRIETAYNANFIPIEIVLRDDCSSIYDLIDRLKSGVSFPVLPGRMLFSFFNGAEYEGLLCSSEHFHEYAGTYILNQNIMSLAEFIFTYNDIVRIDSSMFYKFLTTGLPARIIKVKNPIEVTKDIILRRVTQAVIKQNGFTTNEARRVRSFLLDLNTETLGDEVSSECDCSQEEARQYVALFINQAVNVLNGTTPENQVMARIIRNDESLLKECYEELQQEWEEHNQELLTAAKQHLADTEAEDSRIQAMLDRKKKECATLDGQVHLLQEQIEKKQQLANDVEEQVNAKIDQARKNAAAFIAEYAFTRPLSDSSNVATSPVLTNSHYTEGTYRDIAELEQNDNWEKLLQTVQAELQEAGVSSDKVIGLSGILYAAYLSKVPLLLAGPNGLEIANAFSLALYGCTPGTLHCDGDFNESDLQQATNSNTEIVVIENMFEHSWYSGILRLLSQRRRFYMVVHPFGEDLAIEPNSLINYCFPLYTDSLVDSAPTMNYVGGYMVEPFTEFVQEKINERKCYNKLLKEMKLGLYAKKAVQRVLTDYHVLLPGNTTEEDYTFVLEPLACFLGLSDELEEYKKDHTTQPVGETQ